MITRGAHESTQCLLLHVEALSRRLTFVGQTKDTVADVRQTKDMVADVRHTKAIVRDTVPDERYGARQTDERYGC